MGAYLDHRVENILFKKKINMAVIRNPHPSLNLLNIRIYLTKYQSVLLLEEKVKFSCIQMMTPV